MKDRVKITMLEDGIADVRLIRTDKMNALDPAMFNGICEAIDELKAAKGLRVVVLSGEGRAFCAGLDLSNFSNSGGGGEEKKNEASNGSAWMIARMAFPTARNMWRMAGAKSAHP